MKIGFLAHPTTAPLKSFARAVDLSTRMINAQHSGTRAWSFDDSVPYGQAAAIRSRTGAICSGVLNYFPLTTPDIMDDVTLAQQRVESAVREMAAQGCELVGLGGATSIIGGRGTVTARNVDIPVTSGNSLTTYAGLEALTDAAALLGLTPSSDPITVVGYPGSIALAAARVLLDRGAHVLLVHSGRSSETVLRRHLRGCPDTFETFATMDEPYRRSRLFFSATSSGSVIDEAKLRPGSIVVDVALPRDVVPSVRARSDVMVVDGGYLHAGPEVIIGATLAGLSINRQLNACLAETIVLGLEGRAESYSLGRDLPTEKVLEIGQIARRHGFEPRPLSSQGRPVTPSQIQTVATAAQSRVHVDMRRPPVTLPAENPRALELASRKPRAGNDATIAATVLSTRLGDLPGPQSIVTSIRATGPSVRIALDMGFSGALAGALEDTMPRLPQILGSVLRDTTSANRPLTILATEMERRMDCIAIRCLAQKLQDEHTIAVQTNVGRFRRRGITLNLPDALTADELERITSAIRSTLSDFSTFTPAPITKETL